MTSITSKNYKKLAIQVSLNGFSFCVIDTLLNKPLTLRNFHFNTFEKSAKIEDLFASVYKDNPELNTNYDEIMIVHSNNLSTFVPTALFDEEFLGSYLQYNTKVFETDFLTFDELPNYQINNVYIPYINLNNFFIDQYGSFDYKHASSILVSKLLDISKNNDQQKMFVHVSETHFEIVIIQNQKLYLYNSFEYKTPEDFIYYILFTAEQLQMNPENFILEFLGKIDENDALYQTTYQYVRNVSFVELPQNNSFTQKENREHFILLHS